MRKQNFFRKTVGGINRPKAITTGKSSRRPLKLRVSLLLRNGHVAGHCQMHLRRGGPFFWRAQVFPTRRATDGTTRNLRLADFVRDTHTVCWRLASRSHTHHINPSKVRIESRGESYSRAIDNTGANAERLSTDRFLFRAPFLVPRSAFHHVLVHLPL